MTSKKETFNSKILSYQTITNLTTNYYQSLPFNHSVINVKEMFLKKV